MKPAPFAYVAPTSLEQALELRAEHAGTSAVLAGGQSLLPLLNLRLAYPEVVIDLGHVPELAGVAVWGGGVALGAMTRQRTVERSELVQQRAPLITRALSNVGHVTIRNRGTVGGSIVHADPAAELPAVALALDAQLVARSTARDERTIEARDFFKGFLTTSLEPDELLVEIRVSGLPERSGVAFIELTRRHGDFALAGAGAVVSRAEDGTIADARIVFIGVGASPVRAGEAEAALRGRTPDASAFAEASEHAAAALTPLSDIHASADYRRRVARVLSQRALQEAASND
jgi:aerobic carbon-monoxide dehydrogenase medium subunit